VTSGPTTAAEVERIAVIAENCESVLVVSHYQYRRCIFGDSKRPVRREQFFIVEVSDKMEHGRLAVDNGDAAWWRMGEG